MTERIVFGAIAHQKTILAYHTLIPKLSPIIDSLLTYNIDYSINQRRSFSASVMAYGHTIQYRVIDEYVYISSATTNFPHSICFDFLNHICQEYHQNKSDYDVPTNGRYALEQMLEKMMTYYSVSDEIGTRQIEKQIDEITVITKDNIDKALKRSELLLDIDERSAMLNSTAIQFNKSSKDLKCYAIKQNIKSNICLIFLLIIMLIIIGVTAYLAIKFLIL
jgi:hypothetical protein